MNTLRSYIPRLLTLAFMGLALSAPPAQALSRAEPDITQDFKWAHDSDKVYYIFIGALALPANDSLSEFVPGRGRDIRILYAQKRPREVAGQFTGYVLTSDARSDPQLGQEPITVKLDCISNWCGSLPQAGQKLIMFVEAQEGRPPILVSGPCSGLSYNYNPAAEAFLRSKL